MAEHYRNPYPRPVNLPPGSYTLREGKKLGKAIDKKNKLSKPVYVKSIDDTSKWRQMTVQKRQLNIEISFIIKPTSCKDLNQNLCLFD